MLGENLWSPHVSLQTKCHCITNLFYSLPAVTLPSGHFMGSSVRERFVLKSTVHSFHLVFLPLKCIWSLNSDGSQFFFSSSQKNNHFHTVQLVPSFIRPAEKSIIVRFFFLSSTGGKNTVVRFSVQVSTKVKKYSFSGVFCY